MAKYLCRVRLDRAEMEYKENGKLGLKEDKTLKTENFYLKLTDSNDENIEKDFIKIDDFLKILKEEHTPASIVLRQLMDKMDAAAIINEGETTLDFSNSFFCPLCSPYGKNILVSDLLKKGEKRTITKEGTTYTVYNPGDHIKVCNESDCEIGLYCDGGEDNIYDENGDINESHMYKYHKDVTGHLPVDKKEIEISNVIEYSRDFKGKSIIEKFSNYCNALDETQEKVKLNSSFKNYLTDNNFMDYISFRYDVKEENGGHTLRLKVEITECENFLKRDYVSLELLDENISRFLTYKDINDGFATEDDLHEIGSLKSLTISYIINNERGKVTTIKELTKPVKNENNEYIYTIKREAEKNTIEFTIPDSHTKLVEIKIDDVVKESLKEGQESLELRELTTDGNEIKIYTEEIVPEGEEKTDIVKATIIINFTESELEEPVEEITYNGEEMIIPDSLYTYNNGVLTSDILKLEFDE